MMGVAVYDVKERRIPNLFVGILLCLQIIKLIVLKDWDTYKDNISGCILLLILGYMIFYFRFLGAGDVKLLIAILVGVPVCSWTKFAVVSLSVAAVWSLVLMWKNHVFIERFLYLKNYIRYMYTFKVTEHYWSRNQSKKDTIPLSVPMILGYFCTMGGCSG